LTIADQAFSFLSGEGIDYSTPTGRMLAGIFAALASYERELMHERAAVAGRRSGCAVDARAGPAADPGPGPAGPVAAHRRGTGQRPGAPSGCREPRCTGCCSGGRGAAVEQCRHCGGMTAHAFAERPRLLRVKIMQDGGLMRLIGLQGSYALAQLGDARGTRTIGR